MSKKNEKKVEKKVAVVPSGKSEWIKIFKSTYYLWRFWVKEILVSGKIKKYRFIRDEIGYTGNIAVEKAEVEAAKKVLADYKTKNPDIKDMWYP